MHTIITAGSSSIAQHLVKRLTADGHVCSVIGRNAERLEQLYADNSQVTRLTADLLDSSAVEAAFEQAAALNGVPQGWAHCMGSILIAPLHRTSDEQWMQTINLNLTSAAWSLRAFLKTCRTKTDRASAVMVSSCAADIGLASHEAVAAAKAGIEGLVRSAAATYASENIRINAVAPGLTRSTMAQPFLRTEVLEQAAARQYPLVGINEADDVAGVMAWLLSSGASRITGSVIPVDGGMTAIRPFVK